MSSGSSQAPLQCNVMQIFPPHGSPKAGNSNKKTWTRGHVTGDCGGDGSPFRTDGDPERPANSGAVWGQVSGAAQSKPQTWWVDRFEEVWSVTPRPFKPSLRGTVRKNALIQVCKACKEKISLTNPTSQTDKRSHTIKNRSQAAHNYNKLRAS